jgi:linoleoyl-CoA desaturase
MPATLIALKADFREHGFYRKPTGRIVFELLVHLAAGAAGLALLLFANSLWLSAVGLAVFCMGQMGLATNSHTSAHFATSGRRWVNQALTFLGYPLLLGLGATYWWDKHNALHHGSPNVIGVDDDIDLKPLFAFSQDDVRRSGPLLRRYYDVQWLALPVAVLGMSVNLQMASLASLYRVARSPRGLLATHRIDLTLLVLHWLLWVALPLALLPLRSVLVFTAVRLVSMACFRFAVFGPAHMPAEALTVRPDARGGDPFLLQTSSTLNFRAGPLGAWLISGLQYQIEHHLFPGLSHVHYPAMSRVVAAFCERNGYPYRTLGWGEALLKTLQNFRHPKDVTSELRRLA